MISRHWKAIAKAGEADAYVRHLQTETFSRLAAIPGFIRATVLRREVKTGTEFQIVTIWESMDAVRSFAGPEPEIAVVPMTVQALMACYEDRVVHYEVVETFGNSRISNP